MQLRPLISALSVAGILLGSLTALAQPADGPAMMPPPQFWEQTRTGTVRVLYPRCMGCPPIVQLEQENGQKLQLTGQLEDFIAFENQQITVIGKPFYQDRPAPGDGAPDGALSTSLHPDTFLEGIKVNHFTPGPKPETDFVTGKLEVIRAADGGPETLVLKPAVGRAIPIDPTSPSYDLMKQADGATVTLFGEKKIIQNPDGPIGGPVYFEFKPTGTKFIAKAQVDYAVHIMIYPPDPNAPNYYLSIPGTQKAFPAKGSLEGIQGGTTHWVTMSIDGRRKMTALSASKPLRPVITTPIYPEPPIQPEPPTLDPIAPVQPFPFGGANPHLFADTTGDSDGASQDVPASEGMNGGR
jgi:hypothetical protein